MRVLIAFVLAAHGIAHGVGFAVNWHVISTPELPFSTTVFGGRWDIGVEGIRLVGLLWLVAGAACLAAAASLVGVLSTTHTHPPVTVASSSLIDDAIDSHVRSLQAEHLLDVKSADQHTVKPWFAGRVDFSPDVRDFSSQGYPLIGGRIDYLAHVPVAALVYRKRAHVINAFTWPTAQSDPAEVVNEQRRGYHILRWREGSMNWCLVSDASESTLAELRELIAAHP